MWPIRQSDSAWTNLTCAAEPPKVEPRVELAPANPEVLSKYEDFKTQGEYVGENRAMQVIALGDGDFDILVFAGGLPGDGASTSEEPRRVEGDGETQPKIESAKVSEDGREVMLQIDGLQVGHIHELKANVIRHGSENALLHDRAYYTLNRLRK